MKLNELLDEITNKGIFVQTYNETPGKKVLTLEFSGIPEIKFGFSLDKFLKELITNVDDHTIVGIVQTEVNITLAEIQEGK